MAKPPGNAGFPVVGDKSLEFYKDAVGFVDKKIEQHSSRIFLSRFLNKPTLFVASNSGVQELLNDCHESTELGYKAFMHEIYGDNIIFRDGKEAESLREMFSQLFTEDKLDKYQEVIDNLIHNQFSGLGQQALVAVYSLCKQLMTEICLTLFLDTSFSTSRELADQIVQLTTVHWHGIISVPVNLRLPGIESSTYAKALSAKDKLLKLIEGKLSTNHDKTTPSFMSSKVFQRDDQTRNHILLLTSALVPKALASLLTSFIIATSHHSELQSQCLSDPETLQHVWLEVQRLYPPLAGGRRLVRKDCEVEGYKVSSGHACMYMTRAAQKDPAVFDEPEEFMPSRWKNRNAEDQDKLFLFGAGPRDCIGKQLVMNILNSASQYLLEKYTWQLEGGQDLSLKWLPVLRPKEDVKAAFTSRGESHTAQHVSNTAGTASKVFSDGYQTA